MTSMRPGRAGGEGGGDTPGRPDTVTLERRCLRDAASVLFQ